VRSVISRTAARIVTPLAVLIGAYLLLRGHVALGGGFLASLVVGTAAVFRRLTTGAQTLEQVVERGVVTLVGVGLVVLVATGMLGYWWGNGFLAAATLHLPLPLVGEVAVPSSLLFEAGTIVVVLSVVLAVVQELGGDGP
jgi:multisubunit Na+/H+ antiporter MnhB subunit